MVLLFAGARNFTVPSFSHPGARAKKSFATEMTMRRRFAVPLFVFATLVQPVAAEGPYTPKAPPASSGWYALPQQPAAPDPRTALMAALANPQVMDSLVRLAPLLSNPPVVDAMVKLAAVASNPSTADAFLKLSTALADPKSVQTMSRLVVTMSDPRLGEAMATLTDPKVLGAMITAAAVVAGAAGQSR
jgi:hypothetical protein